MDIDLNADLGEGAGFDAELMPLITSANVSCGWHAGSLADVAGACRLAKRHGVAIGAHPGYDDPANFGRVERPIAPTDLTDLCAYQIGAIAGLATSIGTAVRYVKPHGAMYNQACRDAALAAAIVTAAEQFHLPLLGLPGSQLQAAARERVPFIAEGFADRRYRPDGSLVPRTEPDAFVHNPDEAVKQVEWLIREKGVRTICVHGDNPEAVAFTTAVRAALLARGFTLKPFA